MRRVTLPIIFGAITLAAVPATAQTRGGFEVGLRVADYNYRERLNGTTIVRDDGLLYGLAVGYTQTLGGGFFLRGRAEGMTGSIDYEDDDGERIEGVQQTTGFAEFHAGRDFRLGDATVAPFVGIGHRSLEDESGGETTQSGLEGYDREVQYIYVPVGMSAAFPTGGRSRLTLSGQVNWIVSGDVESKFSELDPEFPDIRADLRGGHGIRLSAMIEVPVGSNAIKFGPFLEHWRVNASEPVLLSDDQENIELFEPANRTTVTGLALSFAF